MKTGSIWGMIGLAGLALLCAPTVTSAQYVSVGGQTCTNRYAYYDYYEGTTHLGGQWEHEGVSCYSDGTGGPSYYSDPGYGGGGGGSGGGDDVVEATEGAEAIVCSTESIIRSRNAQYVAANNGWRIGSAQAGETMRIRWSTGHTETYVHLGSMYTDWVGIVPDTCSAG